MLHTRFKAVPPRLDCGFLLELQFNLPEVPPQNLKRCPQNPKSNLDKCGLQACWRWACGPRNLIEKPGRPTACPTTAQRSASPAGVGQAVWFRLPMVFRPCPLISIQFAVFDR